VLIKPTDFKADQVLIGGSSPGGLSLLSDKDLINGMLATSIVQLSGFGEFDAPSLRRHLAGTAATILPFISETSQELGGITTPKDLETFLELFYLVATSPRLDTSAVAAFKSQVQTSLVNRGRQPAVALSDTITLTMGQRSPRRQPMTLERFATLDANRALAIYRERFSDFGNFTFTVVGNVNLDSLRPMVERWIGGLPSKHRKEKWLDRLPVPPTGQISKVVVKGKEPVSQQVVYFTGTPAATDEQEILAADAAGEILQTRLLEKLREAMGATYGVQVGTSIASIPRKQYQAVVSFTSTPAQADTLWGAAWEVITALRTEGPTADELQKYVEQTRRSTEVQVKSNIWWSGKIGEYASKGAPFEGIALWGKRLDELTTVAVRDAARHYLDPARVARFVLLPEAKPAP